MFSSGPALPTAAATIYPASTAVECLNLRISRIASGQSLQIALYEGNIGTFDRNVCAGAHCNSDVCLSKCRSIVYAVSGRGDLLAGCLQPFNRFGFSPECRSACPRKLRSPSPEPAVEQHKIRHAACQGALACAVFVSSLTAQVARRPRSPRVWDDGALAEWACPLAGLNLRRRT